LLGMDASVAGKLGVAAECAELLGMDASVPGKLGVAAECAELLGMDASVSGKLGGVAECAELLGMMRQFRGSWAWRRSVLERWYRIVPSGDVCRLHGGRSGQVFRTGSR